MNPRELPVYEHKDLIIKALETHRAIVVESPTGSGKTTQMPVILHEAGYSKYGMIGVTQPRRIAALSVSEFIAKQLDVPMPGLVGYKMRFEDKTTNATEIKIMTDGILLQEMKLDPMLTRYSVIIVDEAHERSLNIDFVLGLLKRVLDARPEFRVIVSSATINVQVFSEYFGECPIVKIDAAMFPVTVIYDEPKAESSEALTLKIEEIIVRLVRENRAGDVLVFLPGEKAIKDCMQSLSDCEVRSKLHLIPLYSRLGKDEQEKVFDKPPFGKIKVIISTNIAETSVTIDGITSVIDCGNAKLNYYNPRTYTSSLIEGPVSKASCNQRKGRAGRTRAGSCYRLYSRKDFESRPLFTTEEIFRTDLTEVVLRMAELGIDTFEDFDFISKPSKEAILSAIESLNLLEALNPDRSLSKIGIMMCAFPLVPRHSRVIVEAILNYPKILDEAIIAASFLSTQGPYILPPGEEIEARKAHHAFRDPMGDFVSNLKLFAMFKDAKDKTKFCATNYLDERAMREIVNVKGQLELIVSDLGVPILSGGSKEDYLCAVSRGLIQFVCVKTGRGEYSSLTAERIQIHPGSVMYREDPYYIVAGEIVKTTRMYAMSVSPLTKSMLGKVSNLLYRGLVHENAREAKIQKAVNTLRSEHEIRDFTNKVKIGTEVFDIDFYKGKKKLVVFPYEKLKALRNSIDRNTIALYKDMRGVIKYKRFELLMGEKVELILKVILLLDSIDADIDKPWPRKQNFHSSDGASELVKSLSCVLQVVKPKAKGNELGFVCLLTDSNGNYWYKASRGFHTALNESLASLEALVDELPTTASKEEKEQVRLLYTKLSSFF